MIDSIEGLAGLSYFFQVGTQEGSSLIGPGLLLLLLGLVLLVFWMIFRGYLSASRDHYQRLDRHMDAMERNWDKVVEAISQIGPALRQGNEEVAEALQELAEATRLAYEQEWEEGEMVEDHKEASDSTEERFEDVKTQDSNLLGVEKDVGGEDPEAIESISKSANPDLIDTDNLTRARQLMEHMEDDHPNNLMEAKRLLLQDVNGPRKGDAYICLCETLFWLGDISRAREEKEKFHGKGVEYGKQAVLLSQDSVAAHLWFAANMGSHGVARGIMSSLFYLGDIEKHGNKAMALDEHYFHAAPLRLMGRFYHQCPGWPIGKGDLNKAIKLLERAVELGPEFYLNHLYLAEAYLGKRKKREARALLENLLNQKEFTLLPVYQTNLQAEARKLISKT